MFKSKTFIGVRKWALFLVVAIILSILQSTPGLFAFFEIRPILLLPFVISFAMFYNEKNAAFMGLFCGIFWDCASGRLFGYSSLILLCCGVTVSLICAYWVNRNLINALILTFFALIIYDFFDFLFRYAIWNYEYTWTIFVFHVLPTMLYTMIVAPLSYLLCKQLHGKLSTVKNIEYLG